MNEYKNMRSIVLNEKFLTLLNSDLCLNWPNFQEEFGQINVELSLRINSIITFHPKYNKLQWIEYSHRENKLKVESIYTFEREYKTNVNELRFHLQWFTYKFCE